MPFATKLTWVLSFQVNTNIPESTGDSKEYHGGTNNREYILDDDECPLAILMNHPNSRGELSPVPPCRVPL